MTDPNLSPERLQALRQLLGNGGAEENDAESHSSDIPSPTTPGDSPTGVTGSSAPLSSRLNAKARQQLSPYKRKARRLWQRVNPRNVVARLWRRDQELDSRFATLELLRSEVLSMSLRLDALDASAVAQKVIETSTNLELMKGELRGVSERIEQLGFAIAPGAGLVGATPRMAELRERLNAIDRRVRQLAQSSEAPVHTTAPDTAAEATETPIAAKPGGGSGFDYVGFEQRFRGDPEAILDIVRDRYLELLRPHGPVLDVGCGRGELLSMLTDEGIEAIGVDLDSGMVAEAKSKGLDAHHGDAIAYLRELPEASLGAIISTHVVEHLELNDLVEILELSVTRLKPGGLFIAETPNPATLLVLGNSYILDPTHVWPLHPSLLTFLCERAGFRSVELLFGAPATDYQLELLPTRGETAAVAEAINPALERLNQVLFGPQEYAVIARTPKPVSN